MSKNGSSDAVAGPLRILHCMRAPVGGLFRHVRDLAQLQAQAGHAVGILCDAQTGGATAQEALQALAPRLTLGVTRISMGRQLGIADYHGYAGTVSLARQHAVEIVHGHGAKGGAFARLAARTLKQQGVRVASFYTPHGGSLHYRPGSPAGFLYLGLEKLLAPITQGVIFESAYSQRVFAQKVSRSVPYCVVPNGLAPEDFTPHVPVAEAVDVLFVGELRHLKGVDLLLTALAQLAAHRPMRAVLVGDGPDRARFEAQAKALGLEQVVRFAGVQPAREAFAQAHVLVVPSRAESFPYIVLEGAAAGMPLIATSVGGIPEIVSGSDTALIAPEDVNALTTALAHYRAEPDAARARAKRLQTLIRERFTVSKMAQAIEIFYRTQLGR